MCGLILVYLGKKADCTISMSDADLLDLMTGNLNPQTVCVFMCFIFLLHYRKYYLHLSVMKLLEKCSFVVLKVDLFPQAFFKGKLKITGNMGLAMKLQNLQITPGKAKL